MPPWPALEGCTRRGGGADTRGTRSADAGGEPAGRSHAGVRASAPDERVRMHIHQLVDERPACRARRPAATDEVGMSAKKTGVRRSAAALLVTLLSLQACDNINTSDRHVLSGGAAGAAAGAILGALAGSSVAGAILGSVVGLAVGSFASKDRRPPERERTG
jgi:osmotically inducible lipoprotein OsmB